MPTLHDARDLDALVRGYPSDPFAVLGPRPVSDGGPAVLVRAFRPGAQGIDLIVPGGDPPVRPMERIHDDGVFEARVEGRDSLPDYRLRARYHNFEMEIDDPYRHGRVLSDFDLHLFGEGKLQRAYEKLGAQFTTLGGVEGVQFAVWAPTAGRVSVVGDFNGWDGRVHTMRALRPAGLWELFIPGLAEGQRYQFEIRASSGALLHKADPYAFRMEPPPGPASLTWRRGRYEWRDQAWLESRASQQSWLQRPMAVYEVHLGSWARPLDQPERFLSYRYLAETLVPYVKEMGYTHIELLPVMEHPFYGSWGYQVTAYFAPTGRYGSPDDFKWFIDECHRHGIGVILDWVPAHFPKDAQGLARFDGTAMYEHQDPRQGEHQDWGTLIFNYGRHEVRNFLLSNALFWLDEYHIDGLRVDAVASMLYLDYSRTHDQWVPNRFGGRENLDAIDFVREMNTVTHALHPGSITVAEESTSWPAVSRPTYVGGLGFTYKWNMGWMHDILSYTGQDAIYRRWTHNLITFSMVYAFSENFVLPFSHDEVVHMKGSMLGRIPGDKWQKAAALRSLYGFMYGHPGKKLLFMGGEFGQEREWNHDRSLDWHLLEDPLHAGIQRWVRDLNALYAREAALHELDYQPHGFSWIDCNDSENSVISLLRRGGRPEDLVVMVCNFTPVVRRSYRIGVPHPGRYAEVLNSDAAAYGGSGVGNMGGVDAIEVESHGFPASLALTLPPLGCLVLRPEPLAAS